MADYKTPGVYIEEINTLPASVAPDFIDHFGGPFQEYYRASLSDSPTDDIDPQITITSIGTVPEESPYRLYYQVRMFYANGGGTCYVVSVGTYNDNDNDPLTFPADADIPTAAVDIDVNALDAGLSVCEEIDEITILTVPEAILLSDSNRKTIYDNMLIQCNKLQDRFAVLDVEADELSTVFDDGNDFRNDNIGPDYLKYGAAYYPSLETQIEYSFTDSSVVIADTTTGANGAIWNDQRLGAINTGQTSIGVDIPFVASATITIELVNISDGDTFLIGPETLTVAAAPANPNEFSAGADENDSAENLRVAINALVSTGVTAVRVDNVITLSAIADGATGNGIAVQYTASGADIGAEVSSSELSGGIDRYIDTNLYNRIQKEIKKHKVTLYPCGAIVGIYASVDRDRGVWKAPANVSVNLVNEPSIAITAEEQADLNVDATTGKSINAIRLFNGKGTIVWGARTLAGNDNEWRYVPVRRFYNFMEESIKKATEFVVFEPNSKPTWVRTKAMIENFLTQLWRDGALAGAKPEHAFFVKIGLGETMTALDILEGRMNIEIGVAAVRPAEFIILKFSHKLQES